MRSAFVNRKRSTSLSLFALVVLSIGTLACINRPRHYEPPSEHLAHESGFAREVELVAAIEAKSPNRALAKYEELLDREEARLTDFGFHRGELEFALEQFDAERSVAALPHDAALGLPNLFARRLHAVLSAELGKARSESALGLYEEAEQTAARVIDVAYDHGGLTPRVRDDAVIEAYRILEGVNEKLGRRGRALNSQINRRLIVDFQHSKRGVEQFHRERVLLRGKRAVEQTGGIESFVTAVNNNNMQRYQAQVAQMAATVSSVNASLSQAGASIALQQSGGVVTPQVQILQISSSLSQFQARILSARAAGLSAQPGVAAPTDTPWRTPDLASRLGDPQAGRNPTGLIRGYAEAAVALGGDRAIVRHALEVSAELEDLERARRAGNAPQIIAAVERFSGPFTQLMAAVAEIQ